MPIVELTGWDTLLFLKDVLLQVKKCENESHAWSQTMNSLNFWTEGQSAEIGFDVE
jgi:hypothetical protein